MNHKLKDEDTDRLFEAIMQLQTLEECYNFLRIWVQLLRLKHLPSVLLWQLC